MLRRDGRIAHPCRYGSLDSRNSALDRLPCAVTGVCRLVGLWELLRVVGRDGRVHSVDGRTGEVRNVLHLAASCVMASFLGRNAALAPDERTLILCGAGPGTTVLRMPSALRRIAWTYADSGLLLLTEDGLYRWRGGRSDIAPVSCLPDGARGLELAASANGERFAVAGDGRVDGFAAASGGRLWTLPVAARVTALSLSSEGTKLLVCSPGEAHGYCSGGTGQPRPLAAIPLPGTALCAGFRRRSCVAAVGCDTGDLLVFRAGEDRSPTRWRLGSAVVGVAWSNNGKRLAATTGTGGLSVLRVCR